MTDALSAWFLREAEQGNTPWEEIDSFVSLSVEAKACVLMNLGSSS